MIFMLEIVAVEDVPAGERAKFDEHLRPAIRSELCRVALEGLVDRRRPSVDLLERGPRSRGAARSPAVVLLQDVVEVHDAVRRYGELAEVDDHVRALGEPKPDGASIDPKR